MRTITDIRNDFPFFAPENTNHPVYLDNAATTQKPRVVVESLLYTYLNNSNVHRSYYSFGKEMTLAYENARKTVQHFINANDSSEIIFTKGTTESVNLIASSFGEVQIKENDEIIVSAMEHHSNLLPWQQLAKRKMAKVKILPFQGKGELMIELLPNLINKKTKIISICHASNVLGTINPVEEICQLAHQHGIPVFVDGAQGIPHIKTDVQKLDCDFYAFSGHKLYGPSGTGVLFAKRKWLDSLPPYQYGGEMVDCVTHEEITLSNPPYKFEAGTPNYAGIIGLAKAIDYLTSNDIESLFQYETALSEYVFDSLKKMEGITIHGLSSQRIPLVSFSSPFFSMRKLEKEFEKASIAIRTGSLCAQPVMDYFFKDNMARLSLCFYNTKEEIDFFLQKLKDLTRISS